MLAAPPPRAEPRPPLSQRHGPPRTAAAAAGWPGVRRLSGVRSPAGGAAAAVSAGRGTRLPPQRGEGGGTSPSRSVAEPDLSPSPLVEREGEEFGPALLVCAFELPLPPLSLETGARKRPPRGCRPLGSCRRRSLPRPRPPASERGVPETAAVRGRRIGCGVVRAPRFPRVFPPRCRHSAFRKIQAEQRRNAGALHGGGAERSVSPLCPSGASAPLARRDGPGGGATRWAGARCPAGRCCHWTEPEGPVAGAA